MSQDRLRKSPARPVAHGHVESLREIAAKKKEQVTGPGQKAPKNKGPRVEPAPGLSATCQAVGLDATAVLHRFWNTANQATKNELVALSEKMKTRKISILIDRSGVTGAQTSKVSLNYKIVIGPMADEDSHAKDTSQPNPAANSSGTHAGGNGQEPEDYEAAEDSLGSGNDQATRKSGTTKKLTKPGPVNKVKLPNAITVAVLADELYTVYQAEKKQQISYDFVPGKGSTVQAYDLLDELGTKIASVIALHQQGKKVGDLNEVKKLLLALSGAGYSRELSISYGAGNSRFTGGGYGGEFLLQKEIKKQLKLKSFSSPQARQAEEDRLLRQEKEKLKRKGVFYRFNVPPDLTFDDN